MSNDPRLNNRTVYGYPLEKIGNAETARKAYESGAGGGRGVVVEKAGERAKYLAAQAAKKTQQGVADKVKADISGNTPQEVIANKRGPMVSPKSYQFPSSTPTFALSMEFLEYRRSKIESPSELLQVGRILLPIPANLTNTTTFDYENVDFGPFGGPIGQAVAEAVDVARAGGSVSDSLKSSAGRYSSREAGIDAAKALISKVLWGSWSKMADQAGGFAVNPNLGVAFNGVNLKTHEYSWKFSPNSESESKTLMEMIEFLKNRAHPEKRQFTFGYPDVVQLKFIPNELMLYSHKLCFIESITENYAPSGPSFFRGTLAPTEIDLTIRFKEIAVFTREDFNKINKPAAS